MLMGGLGASELLRAAQQLLIEEQLTCTGQQKGLLPPTVL